MTTTTSAVERSTPESGPSVQPRGVGPAPTVGPVSKLAVPFLGLLGAVQGSCPNIASTALVGASRSLHMAGSTQALAASVQTLAIAASVITTGLLADRLGRRRVLMAALIVGAIGNVVVIGAPVPIVYILGMAITGVGLGAVFCAAFGYLKAVVTPARMASAVGVFSAVVSAATLIFTFVGGTLASSHWRLAFVLVPVVCIACLLLTPVLLPKVERIGGGNLDLVGQGLLIVGIVSFLYSLSQFAHSLTSPKTLVPLVVGVILLAAFYLWEDRFDGRFYPVDLFRSPVFLAALCAGFIFNFGTAVAFLQVTNLWQYINGLTTSKVAIWQLPMMIAGIISGLATGRLISRGLSNRAAILIGGAATAAGFILLAMEHGSATLLGFLPGLILVGGGVIIAAVPFGNLIILEAPPRHLGPVTSSRTTFGQFFYTIGFSLSAVVIDRLTVGGVTHRLQHAGVPANQLSTGLDAVNAYAAKGSSPTTSLGRAALRDAVVSYGHAFTTMFFIAGGLVAAIGVVAFILLAGGRDSPPPVTVAT